MLADLKRGDIVFTADNGIISRYIRVKQGSFPYSHVCIADGEGGIYTTNAKRSFTFKPPFVRFEYGRVNANSYLLDKDKYCVKRYNGLEDLQADHIIEYCKSMIGQDYPYQKLFKMIMDGYRGEGVCKTEDKPHGNKICSEGVAAAYASVGITLSPQAENCNPSGYDIREIYMDSNLRIVDMYDYKANRLFLDTV